MRSKMYCKDTKCEICNLTYHKKQRYFKVIVNGTRYKVPIRLDRLRHEYMSCLTMGIMNVESDFIKEFGKYKTSQPN